MCSLAGTPCQTCEISLRWGLPGRGARLSNILAHSRRGGAKHVTLQAYAGDHQCHHGGARTAFPARDRRRWLQGVVLPLLLLSMFTLIMHITITLIVLPRSRSPPMAPRYSGLAHQSSSCGDEQQHARRPTADLRSLWPARSCRFHATVTCEHACAGKVAQVCCGAHTALCLCGHPRSKQVQVGWGLPSRAWALMGPTCGRWLDAVKGPCRARSLERTSAGAQCVRSR